MAEQKGGARGSRYPSDSGSATVMLSSSLKKIASSVHEISRFWLRKPMVFIFCWYILVYSANNKNISEKITLRITIVENGTMPSRCALKINVILMTRKSTSFKKTGYPWLLIFSEFLSISQPIIGWSLIVFFSFHIVNYITSLKIAMLDCQ